MSCNTHGSIGGGDGFERRVGSRPFDMSATAWLLGQGVRYLNTAGKEGELAYGRVVELLARCAPDVLDAVMALYRKSSSGDTMLRWNLLHMLGDAGDQGAVDFLIGSALAPVPEAGPDEGCERTSDIEVLVRTMAVQALGRIAGRHPQTSDSLLKVVAGHPARPVLVEAIKCAGEHGLKDRARELLPEDERWLCEIRRAHAQELFADPERKDGKERSFTPPRSGEMNTAPKSCRCTC